MRALLLCALLAGCGSEVSVGASSNASASSGAGPACTSGTPAASFPSGVYFVLLEMEQPLSTQLQMYSVLVRRESAVYSAQLTNADRNATLVCSPPCPNDLVCSATSQTCLAPSERASSEDDYIDFVPNSTPPEGYTFTTHGCVYDAAGATSLTSGPTDFNVEMPAVQLEGLREDASYSMEAGVWRGRGSFTLDDVSLGPTPFGPASGTLRARLIREREVPPGLPSPPE